MTDTDSKKIYILEYIDNLGLADRKEILKIIYDSNYKDKIVEKGSGCEIKLDVLSPELIDEIYDNMLAKITNDKSILTYLLN